MFVLALGQTPDHMGSYENPITILNACTLIVPLLYIQEIRREQAVV